jgi:chitosanase
MINSNIKNLIFRILNCFEMGKAEIDYSAIYIYHDGPNDRRQLTLSRGYTEYGNLQSLIRVYINDGGFNAEAFKKYVMSIGRLSTPLVDDKTFVSLIVKSAKEDPIFRAAEDKIFEDKYFAPAFKFFADNGFKENLSMAVIMDSYLHSGSIPDFLRKRFDAKTPKNGGDEKVWIEAYVQTRNSWLAHHSREILRGTVYRTQFFLKEISKKNWDLNAPFIANGIKIS